MTDFINQVKGSAPWDLKAEGNSYSKLDLGSEKAMYNGHEYNFDDFGNTIEVNVVNGIHVSVMTQVQRTAFESACYSAGATSVLFEYNHYHIEW